MGTADRYPRLLLQACSTHFGYRIVEGLEGWVAEARLGVVHSWRLLDDLLDRVQDAQKSSHGLQTMRGVRQHCQSMYLLVLDDEPCELLERPQCRPHLSLGAVMTQSDPDCLRVQSFDEVYHFGVSWTIQEGFQMLSRYDLLLRHYAHLICW